MLVSKTWNGASMSKLRLPLHPVDALLELGVEFHQPQRVERFDDGEPDRVAGHEELLEAAAAPA